MNEATRVAEGLAAQLSGLQALVVIMLIPFLVFGFVVFMLMRRRLGLSTDAPGREGAQDLVERTNRLIDGLQAEVERSRTMLDRYVADLDTLRMARLTLIQRAQQLGAAALAARTMVHQYERQLGLAETAFEPLEPAMSG